MANEQAAEVLTNQDGPNLQDNAQELANAAAAQAGEVDPQATENDLDDEGHGGKRLGGWQRKIKRLEQEKETLIETLRKVGGNASTTQTQATTQEEKPPVKPKITDFSGTDGWEKYEAAKDEYFEKLADFKANQAVTKFKTESRQQSEQDKVVNGFASQCAEAEKTFPDFKAVAFSEHTPMSDAMRDAILTSDYGALIAYELGQNQDEAERIARLNPVVAIREIGKIESRIADKKSAAKEDDDGTEPPAATTKAPRPPVPVRRTASSPTDLDDKLPYKEWERRRNAQLKARQS